MPDRRDSKPGRPGKGGPARGPRRDAPRPATADRPRLPPDPRRVAHQMLTAVTEEQRILADLLGRSGPVARLDPPVRARAQRLTTETLRHLGALDALLGQHLAHMPPLPVLNVLRIAAYELLAGEAAHGVVNSAVTQVAAMPRHNRAKGMANAVLRKVAGAGLTLTDLHASRIPEWLRDPLVMAWGEDIVAACETAQSRPAPLDLTPRDPATTKTLAETLNATVLPTGTLRITGNVQVTALPGYDTGEWWAQDAAAAIPVRVLNPQQGEKVLDLCAAPGGKTMQLAAAGARVTALDISSPRSERIAANLARTGLSARTVTGDAMEFTETGWDAILLDAPCSATGTLRRHPDLPHARDGSEIGDLIALQARMIDHALGLLKPGGRLVFCTCSLIPDEGEVQAEEAIARHPGLTADRAALDLPGLDPAWITEEGGLRLRPDFWPDLGGMDGFYVVVLRRPR